MKEAPPPLSQPALLPYGPSAFSLAAAISLQQLLSTAQTAKMASGVKVHDDVKKLFDDMKVVKANCDPGARCRLVFLGIDGDFIVPCRIIKQCDLDKSGTDPYDLIVEHLLKEECCYILYDCHYERRDVYKEDLVSIMWASDQAPIKKKMCYASSRKALTSTFSGIKYDFQVNDITELNTRAAFAETLGMVGEMNKLECKCVD
ncbi:non-muscle cofilin 1-like [Synchiropus splendidus]|uniref:non-muscle cofilin 1-like n=1 Tax=Synchiropus splendidus TaxID=270530 RepID=UPI00237E66EE|nr:non-muscle cofilin 1-like [Synchiropus splendidus]